MKFNYEKKIGFYFRNGFQFLFLKIMKPFLAHVRNIKIAISLLKEDAKRKIMPITFLDTLNLKV